MEGRKRKKTEQESSAECDYRRLAESFGFPSPLRRLLSLAIPASSFSFFFSLPSDAKLPSGCSYVHVSYRGTKDVGIDQSSPRLRK